MYGTHDNRHALVALPVMLAVLLVALSMPVTCAAAAAPARRAPVAPVAAVPQDMTLTHAASMQGDGHATHHPAPAPEPAKRPVPQPMSSDNCKHSIPTIAQVSTGEQQQVRALDVAAPAIVPVPAPMVALAVLVDERPGDPPGITLTASHLRI